MARLLDRITNDPAKAGADRAALERWEGEGGRASVRERARRSAPALVRSVLVPVDLTPSSDRILGRLALLPLAEDAKITLLHVVPANLSPREQRGAERDAAKVLAAEARHLRQSLPRRIRVEPVVTLGAAAREIAVSANKVKAELIVMGRGGGRPLRDALLGSTAERVLRQARIPVLVVRLPPRAAYRRPALALDLDSVAHEVVRVLLAVLPRPQPPLDVVHAYDIPYRTRTYPSLAHAESEDLKQELQLKARGKLAKLLSASLAEANVELEDAPRWRTHVRYGSPRLVVEQVVRKAETDLLVLGTRGYSGAAYLFLGTVAGDLLRNVNCDVLVVPPARR